MQRWIWVIVAVCVSTAVYFTIRYGLRPKPIPVLNPTVFQDSRELGGVIYKRLKQNIRAERVVLLGSQSEEDQAIWAGLLQGAEADREKLVTFRPEDVKAPTFVTDIAQKIKAGQLIVIFGDTAEISHLVEGSLSKQIDKAVRHPVLSISSLRLAVDPAEYDNIQTQCLDASAGKSASQRLDCAAQRVARKFLKRRLAPEKMWAVMERHGLKEYLLFVHRPTAPKPETAE